MNDQIEEDFVRLLVNEALKDLPPSSRNTRQRRWRTNRTKKPYSPTSPVFLHYNQQIEDTNLCLPHSPVHLPSNEQIEDMSLCSPPVDDEYSK
ncbi:unnamed protein product [Rotaria sp. Silwood2]|nr:unnamed protein product [Rotaria sp. Silwood2]CAF3114393.1 unnamed protein product [Rotaria sp. Silwood2]CAF3132830.1 unnamed protein product [Rotaria sp. Silwood2]CAF3306699.1 unnamed protein product [Rotaria sp. Silwood2]CAF3985369.1 unnamed protein product [Rotaria sp. Silwood2]